MFGINTVSEKKKQSKGFNREDSFNMFFFVKHGNRVELSHYLQPLLDNRHN